MSTSGDVAYVDLPPAQARAVAASELRGGLAWMAFGIAVLALSWRMDRLEAQHINPYTVPGLLPGLLGVVMILLGVLLALRSWRRGGRLVRGAAVRDERRGGAAARPRRRPDRRLHRRPARPRPAVLGRRDDLRDGVDPAAAGAAARRRRRRLTLREAAFALAVGLASGWVITWVFQDAFLVRLP